MRMLRRLYPLLMAVVIMSGSALAAGPSLDAAIKQATLDVEAASRQLINERNNIAELRRPMADEWQLLQREVAALRQKIQRQRDVKRRGDHERTLRSEQLERQENEYRYLVVLLQEYRRNLDARLNESEALVWRERVAKVDDWFHGEADPLTFSPSAAILLGDSVSRINRKLGGHQLAGVVLDEQGLEVEGRIALFGPLAYFASTDQSRSGLVVTRFGAAHPALEEHLPIRHEAIASLVRGEEAVVPVDVSGGDALKIQKASVSLAGELRKGGHVMVPLLAVAAIAFILAIWKWWDLLRLKIADPEHWKSISGQLMNGQHEEARSMANRAADPLKSLYLECIACRAASREQLEELLHEHIISYVPRLERHLGTLAVLGGIAPLLGLLGTVTGMIHTFQMVTLFGSGDARLLSGGISEALITTKYGLIIAVPVLLAHAFLSRHARGKLAELEQTAIGMVNDVKGRAE